MNEKILIIDDEKDICTLIQALLEDEGYETITASNSDKAYELIKSDNPDLVVQDIWLQDSDDDGIDILTSVKKTCPDLPFIMISGHGTIETAVSSIKLGAYDFIEKPFNSDRLLLMIQRALENAQLKQQNIELKNQTKKQIQDVLGQIPEDIRQTLDKVSKTNSRILITGEAGTGKNIAAQYVHNESQRSNMPFMVLNCVSMDFEKLEIELFGTVNGAVNGSSKVGLLELVDGGTLLLDEVMNLPIETQSKILTLLQDQSYYKMGSNHKTPADIRVIATTSADIDAKLASGEFREDLYYRLNVMPIHMPSLQERKQDIPKLVASYLPNKFTDNAMLKLKSHQWSGNIKQLYNVLEWVSIMNDNPNAIIDIQDLPPEFGGATKQIDNDDKTTNELIESVMQMGLREAREHFERHYLLSQVNKFDGNISKTSVFIGMERSALHRKLKSLDVFSDDKQNVA